ncbi:MAG TPA: tetratricopeptide repeat protein [Pyrinomonadaceae bacterium]|nr:tetratricopeptide repeat protein [Pyrinomonadaceae bacterium]
MIAGKYYHLIAIWLVLAPGQTVVVPRTRTVVVAQTNTDLINRLETAATLIRDDKLVEAERQLTIILKSNANQPDALNLLGAVRAKQRRLDDAERLFSRAVTANSSLISARMNLVQVYLIRGKPDNAISELLEVLRLDPTNAEAFDKLHPLLLSQKRGDEFIKLIEQAKTSRAVSSSLLISLGDIYLQKRNAAKAEENFRLALDQQSDNADAILGLAQVAQLTGDRATASAYLDRAKKSVVNSAGTLHRFAIVAWEADRYEEANLALTQAIKLNPKDPTFYVALGNTWLKKPDLVEAEQAFRRALELQSDNPQAQMYLGYTLFLQGKYPEARQQLEKSLLKQPNVPQTFYYLGLISQEEGHDQSAIELFSRTLQLESSFADIHFALGRSYLTLKNYTRAQEELELAVKLKPDDPKAHYQLAVLYARLKDPQRSQQHMQIMQRLEEAAKSPKKPTP